MTFEELEKAIAEVEKQAGANKFKLIIEYCNAHNTVKIGDIVTDKYGRETIRVDKITYSSGSIRLDPQCVYRGQLVTKKGEPRKDGRRGVIYQSNIES